LKKDFREPLGAFYVPSPKKILALKFQDVLYYDKRRTDHAVGKNFHTLPKIVR